MTGRRATLIIERPHAPNLVEEMVLYTDGEGRRSTERRYRVPRRDIASLDLATPPDLGEYRAPSVLKLVAAGWPLEIAVHAVDRMTPDLIQFFREVYAARGMLEAEEGAPSMSLFRSRRLGRFRVPLAMINEEPHLAHLIMARCSAVLLNAFRPSYEAMEYVGIADDFEELAEVDLAAIRAVPLYKAIIRAGDFSHFEPINSDG